MRRYPAAEYEPAGPGSLIASARHAVSAVGTGRHRDRLGRRRLAAACPAGKGQRAPPQRGDIPATEAPSRTGQHPHRRRAGRRVGDQPQHGHDVGDLGDGQQPGQPDDLDRDSAGAKRIGDGCGIGVAAHQHRGGRRADAVGAGSPVVLVQVVGDPLAFGPHIGEQRAADGAGRGVRARAQRVHRNRASPRLRRDGVGHTAARAAGCASWSAAPGPARGCRRIGGSRW